MKKQFLLLLSIAAISALAACDINAKPSSSSFDSSSSDSSSSSSSREDIGPVPSDIVAPTKEDEQDFVADKDYSDYLLLNYRRVTLAAGSTNNNSVKLRGIPRPLQPADNLSFTSLDSSIATVDEEGNVTAVKQGETSIEVADKDHPEVKKLVPVTVYGNLVLPVPEVEGVHFTQAEIDAAQEGDPAYGKTVDDWKVEPADEIPNDKEKIAKITDEMSNAYNGVHFTKAEINAAQEGDPAYGKTTDDWKIEPLPEVTEIVNHELREMSTYKNGVLQFYSAWDECLVASKDEAYFRITETDGDTKNEDGAMSYLDTEWIFNTNKFYDTYVFHKIHGVKNYYPVSTVNYMPDDPSVNNRFAPLYDILDNLFTTGHDIFTNAIEGASLEDLYNKSQGMITHDFTNVVKNAAGGFLDENGEPSSKTDFFFDCTVDFSDSKADQDDENQYGIPYGTPMVTYQRMIYTIRDNEVLNCRIELTMDYEIDGDKYQKVYYIDNEYERITDENRSSFLIIPDINDYNLVDYLFAI